MEADKKVGFGHSCLDEWFRGKMSMLDDRGPVYLFVIRKVSGRFRRVEQSFAWQYGSRLYTDVLPLRGNCNDFGRARRVRRAQDCSRGPVIGSPMWLSCLATDSVGSDNPNNGPTIFQNGPIGASSYNPAPPKGHIIFEGYGITNGVWYSGAPTRSPTTLAVSTTASTGGALQANLKTFKVPITTTSVISSTLTSGAPFSIISTTPVANLVSQSAQGLVLTDARVGQLRLQAQLPQWLRSLARPRPP
jgi:hypothetical protein